MHTSKFFTSIGIFFFLVCTGIPAFADSSQGSQQGTQSGSSQMGGDSRTGTTSPGMGSTIESQNPSQSGESEQQRGARPGGVGEGGDRNIFGSSSNLPPGGETSPSHEGADQQQQELERQLQEER